MDWKKPKLEELNCGMEINMYYPAEEGENWPLMMKAKRRIEGAPLHINQDEQDPKRRG